MGRILISGASSSCGKTSVTCAIIKAFLSQGIEASACKCGPDYIDPMFHRAAGARSTNIDPFFMTEIQIKRALAVPGICVAEGVMGYYDGIGDTSDCSTYSIAKAALIPVVLAVNASSSGASLGALIEGFARHTPDSGIKGVIFNQLSPSRYPALERAARLAGVIPLGFMPKMADCAFPSRRLGLATPKTTGEIERKIEMLGIQAEKTLDLEALKALAQSAPALCHDEEPFSEAMKKASKKDKPILAVSKDEAFCFRYEESLEALQEMGAVVSCFSPIRDEKLPQADGLYLCGGYPELFLPELSENKSMQKSIKSAVLDGMPTLAECGGFMCLLDSINGYPASGVIKGSAFDSRKLQRFGYCELTAMEDTLLASEGETAKAHEFHYWDTDNPGKSFLARKAGTRDSWPCIHATKTLHAGFPHLHLSPEILARFYRRMTNA
jgi:cobyrinic acid a,c-diamide synthase